MNVAVVEARIEDRAANVTEDSAELESEARADRAARPRMPLSVALVWLCAFAGAGAYAVGLCFPQWVNP